MRSVGPESPGLHPSRSVSCLGDDVHKLFEAARPSSPVAYLREAGPSPAEAVRAYL